MIFEQLPTPTKPKPGLKTCQALVPNTRMFSNLSEIDRLLNNLTGVNRFQTLKQRAQRMFLRICFINKALVDLKGAEDSLKEIGLRSMTHNDLHEA